MPAPKPRHSHTPALNQVPEQSIPQSGGYANEPIPEPPVSPISMSPPREAIHYPATIGQVLPDSIELCCPVCGYSNLSQNKMGETNCNECDYIESDEVLR
jgi:hypothetical protein